MCFVETSTPIKSITKIYLNMFDVSTSILSVIPNLPNEKVQELEVELVALGVEQAEDLQHIQETDLISIVNKISARKLVKAWKGMYMYVFQVLQTSIYIF